MSEKTTVMSASSDKTQVLFSTDAQQEVKRLHQKGKSKFSVLKGLAAGGVVLGAGAALASFMPSAEAQASTIAPAEGEALVPVYEEPTLATSVNDNMTYQEAFDAAREELGAGHYFTWHGQNFSTYTQEEWAALDSADQENYQQYLATHTPPTVSSSATEEAVPVVVYDVAPEATSVNDEMSFQEAFAHAREEVGAGGVFSWHGKLYSTYYQHEWQSMDAADRQEFAHSLSHVTPHSEEVITMQETLVSEEMMVIEGQPVRVAVFEDAEGAQIVRVDADLDGTYDYIYQPEGHLLVNIESGEIIDLNHLEEPGGEELTVLSSEEVMIEGCPGMAHLMSDGSVQLLVDTDHNGAFDTHFSVDQATGEVVAIDLGDDEIRYAAGDVEPIVEPEDIVIDEDAASDEPSGHWVQTDEEDSIIPFAEEDDDMSSEGLLANNDLHEEFGDDVLLGGDVSEWV